ncbi:transmembrane and coiled-coil domain-containing protein 4-like [Notechis scutatus]|uniref:Transmembrane and coiled-coil domain-containing protein 4-like n=1 Tax=Notechis scutatus TaxID=8663 RepID=A0A6J1VTV4_9SAUR|nr:transmembrane and coiled-coil domain-containing protein 4-like [Notechis scutatus]
MSADPRPGWRPWRSRPKEEEEDTGPRTGPGAQLGEPGKYAYAALCAVSLASLFPDQEESAYRTGVVENLVRWLELSDTVMPSMLAFAGGLGAEGTETFARILLSEPLLADQPGSVMRDLVSFSLKDGVSLDFFFHPSRWLCLLPGIVTALTWPASLLAVAGVIDNPWGVCLHRSTEVGKHMAQILLSRRQGKRPVTLVGFSLGARVIYFCLQEMAKEKDCEGIVEDVVLLGAPVEGDPKSWKQITKVISGRIINGFCRYCWSQQWSRHTSTFSFFLCFPLTGSFLISMKIGFSNFDPLL